MKALLLSNSPSARESAMSLLVQHLRAMELRSGPQPREGDHVVAQSSPTEGLAVMLALCELGKDCSEDAYAASLLCALSWVCGQPLWSDWKKGLREDEVRATESLRQRIVEAVTRKDLSILADEGSR